MIDNLKDAIEHAKEMAIYQRKVADTWKDLSDRVKMNVPSDYQICLERAEEYERLAEWLTELKQRRDNDRTEKFITAIVALMDEWEISSAEQLADLLAELKQRREHDEKLEQKPKFHWIHRTKDWDACSNCLLGFKGIVVDNFNFCPFCGAERDKSAETTEVENG